MHNRIRREKKSMLVTILSKYASGKTFVLLKEELLALAKKKISPK